LAFSIVQQFVYGCLVHFMQGFIMSLLTILLLFGSGFLTGVVNAIAGGGTFLTFATLTLAGLPAIVANTTSSFVQFPGNVTSSLAYRDEIVKNWRGYLGLAFVSAVGSAAGALMLLSLSDPHFRAMVPWLLLAATAVFAAGPVAQAKSRRAATEWQGRNDWPVSGFDLWRLFWRWYGHHDAGRAGPDYRRCVSPDECVEELSVYCHFIGRDHRFYGQRLCVLAACGGSHPGSALGGYVGVWAAKRVPQNVMRTIVVTVGVTLAVYYFWKG